MGKQAKRYVLRELVLQNGGIMAIVPNVLRSISFRGWHKNQIRTFVYQLRKEFTDGEVWALYKDTIFAREKDVPPEIWKHLCDRRANKIKGVANQNIIFDINYKKHRKEEEAQSSLDSNIEVLGETMDSSFKLVKTLSKLEGE